MRCALIGDSMSLGFPCFFLYHACSSECELSALVQHHASLSHAMFPTMMVLDSNTLQL